MFQFRAKGVLFLTRLALILLPTSVASQRQVVPPFVTEIETAIAELQRSYDFNTGLYGNLWWNSANVITMLADFQDYFPSSINQTTSMVFPNTFEKAPRRNNNQGFLNGFYDDELWWALAWIKVFDVTSDVKYLTEASTIFENAKSAWGSSPCGGLWWDKFHKSDNAIENSLYLTTAAKLASRIPDSPSGYYLNEAIKAYEFMVGSGLINSQNLINDGLHPQSFREKSCKNNGGATWSYNQGAILSGLADLTMETGDAKYNDLAVAIATAAIILLTDGKGILHDPCEPVLCRGDGAQFKGVFARNVQSLVSTANMPAGTSKLFVQFLIDNASSVWATARRDSKLGPIWSGPYSESNVPSQSSALDVLVAAACT